MLVKHFRTKGLALFQLVVFKSKCVAWNCKLLASAFKRKPIMWVCIGQQVSVLIRGTVCASESGYFGTFSFQLLVDDFLGVVGQLAGYH